MKSYTLLKPIKVRGIQRLKGTVITDRDVSERQIKWLAEQGAIARPDKQVTVSLAAPSAAKQTPRVWPGGCCGRR